MEATAEKLITALGFPPEVARMYERLQTLSGRPYDEVCDALGLAPGELEVVAAALIDAEILHVGAESVEVLSPALAISRMIEDAAVRARTAHDRLLTISRAVPHIAARGVGLPAAQLEESSQPVEGELFRARYEPEMLSSLLRRTTGDVAWLRPDQWSLPWEDAMNSLVAELVSGGRRVRAVYPVRALTEAPGVLQARVEIGEELRLLPEVPTRLLVIGTTHALLPEPFGTTAATRVMVRQRSIVNAMGLFFEQLWERSSPIAEYERGPRSDEVRRQLLGQLASGAQDEQIARRLGTSLRTVRRRVAELMAELGAESRFQAGAEAARRGWL